MRKARSCSPCACFRPCETAPPLSNSRSHVRALRVQGIRGARTSALRRSSNGHHHHRGLLHGGLSTTISAIADAYFKPGAPLLADAITLLPYYGARSLRGLTNEALNNGRGVFIASLTSNQEGASMQTAIRQSGDFKGKTVAFGIASTAQKFNDDIDGMGSVGSSSAPP